MAPLGFGSPDRGIALCRHRSFVLFETQRAREIVLLFFCVLGVPGVLCVLCVPAVFGVLVIVVVPH